MTTPPPTKTNEFIPRCGPVHIVDTIVTLVYMTSNGVVHMHAPVAAHPPTASMSAAHTGTYGCIPMKTPY